MMYRLTLYDESQPVDLRKVCELDRADCVFLIADFHVSPVCDFVEIPRPLLAVVSPDVECLTIGRDCFHNRLREGAAVCSEYVYRYAADISQPAEHPFPASRSGKTLHWCCRHGSLCPRSCLQSSLHPGNSRRLSYRSSMRHASLSG